MAGIVIYNRYVTNMIGNKMPKSNIRKSRNFKITVVLYVSQYGKATKT